MKYLQKKDNIVVTICINIENKKSITNKFDNNSVNSVLFTNKKTNMLFYLLYLISF